MTKSYKSLVNLGLKIPGLFDITEELKFYDWCYATYQWLYETKMSQKSSSNLCKSTLFWRYFKKDQSSILGENIRKFADLIFIKNIADLMWKSAGINWCNTSVNEILGYLEYMLLWTKSFELLLLLFIFISRRSVWWTI